MEKGLVLGECGMEGQARSGPYLLASGLVRAAGRRD